MVQGNTTIFTFSKPRNVVVQVNGNIFDCLHLFTNEIERNAPSVNDSSVIYFGPGVHTVTGGTLTGLRNQTVYVVGGGVLKASVSFTNATNDALHGRGIFYQTSNVATIAYSSRITIDGVISLNRGGITVGSSKDVTVNNYRSLSSTSGVIILIFSV
jgi:hypothetical protein